MYSGAPPTLPDPAQVNTAPPCLPVPPLPPPPQHPAAVQHPPASSPSGSLLALASLWVLLSNEVLLLLDYPLYREYRLVMIQDCALLIPHALFGCIALFTGPLQFSSRRPPGCWPATAIWPAYWNLSEASSIYVITATTLASVLLADLVMNWRELRRRQGAR